ncbi:BTAD domain-containing putative transcriptional regulator [Tsukamurella spumae]|uniref:AAA family ATPase n=1 Tax=Tsukamurella spumae TaxID=44753 RepID=A0A846X2B7_9ACTN|nr:BTAD domain-containing putative transcriptional regulator [Tsukamurella spumae]NKY19293.1 AAA family ATPase [Tsukamurella spumae]
MVQIRVLGPLEAFDRRGRIELGGPKQRAVLALLLIARGRVVSVDRLIDDLWHGEPPRRALAALQAYVSNLRRLLEPERAPRAPAQILVSRAPGYAIRLDAAQVDAWRFESVLEESGSSAEPVAARRLLDEALALWSGPAYAEFAASSWATVEIGRLLELHAVARVRQAEAALRCGDATGAVLLADSLRRDHPLREDAWRILAHALYVAGRQGESLAVLREARAVLADELGLDPGPALAALEADILAQRIPVDLIRRPLTTPESPQAAPPPGGLLGRAAEVAAIVDAAETVRTAREPGLCLVTGEAGDGKSALLGHVARVLRARGWEVVTGRCPEAEGAPPAWAWSQVLGALGERGEEGRCRALVDRLAGAEPAGPTGAEQSAEMSRFLLHQDVVDALCTAAARGPVAILLDDLHRAESETLNLLIEVAAAVPVLVVGAYRPDEVGRHLEIALGSLAVGHPLRLRLPGLALDDATALVAEFAHTAPSPDTMRRLLERTGGNPFHLKESARLLRSEGELVALSAVPAGVRDVLRRRLMRLPDVAVSVLRLAALVGRTADLDVLVRAAEVEEEVVFDGLDAGQLAGLLEVDATTVSFTHVLVRDTLIADLPRLRRVRWHRRIARALEEVEPSAVAAIAHHLGAALGADNAAEALRYALAAADLADAGFAHDIAAENLRAAERAYLRIPGYADRDRIAHLCRLSRTLLADGRLEEARETRLRAVRLARGSDTEMLDAAITAWDLPTPLITRRYGSVDTEIVDAVRERLEQAELPPDVRCRLLVVLIEEVYGEQDEVATEAAREVLELSAAVGDPLVRGLALVAYLTLPRPLTPPAERAELADELIGLGESANREVFGLIGHFTHVQAAGAVGALDEARAHLEEMDRLVGMFRWGQAIASDLLIHAMLAHAGGRFAEAAEHYREAGDVFARQRIADGAGMIALAQFSVRLSLGDVAEFVEVLGAIDSSAGDVLCDPVALALLSAGRRSEAVRVRRAVRPVRRDFFHSLLLTTRGIAVAAIGGQDEVADVYDELLRYRGELGGADTGCYVVGPVDTVLGDLAARLGGSERAADHYRAAVQLAERCGNEVWARAARNRLQEFS